jgi:threonylcarbamoyladenosine tRNA methylthiotransferase MtaB
LPGHYLAVILENQQLARDFRALCPVFSQRIDCLCLRLLWYLSRMSTFYIEQFGCRATQADGAALERQLLDRGHVPSHESTNADIVVINTCTVTAAADAQARDSIRKLHAANPSARVIVTGCYAQRAPEELAVLPGVTWVVGNSRKPQIPHLVDELLSGCLPAKKSSESSANSSSFIPSAALSMTARVSHTSLVGERLFFPDAGRAAPSEAASNAPSQSVSSFGASFVPASALNAASPSPISISVRAGLAPPSEPQRAQILTGDIFEYHSLLAAPVLGGEGNHTRPTLKIQDGCNLRCSYCVIPFVRGKSRSLPPDTVVEEIRRLSESGYREIVLSGINLGTYGRDLSPRVEFEDLLRRILDETPLERVRISSIEPQDVTRDLVEMFAATDRIAQHFHMPLQSGSDRILAAMHRWYRTEHYARRVELIHERLPNAAIGADVITGFPGETEDDHAATLAFIERLPFTYLHVFSFSQRPGTKAAALPDQVPGHIIKLRARELRALADRKSSAFRHSQLGRTLRVLTLHRKENSSADTTPALTSNYLTLEVSGLHPANEWIEALVDFKLSRNSNELQAEVRSSNE